MGMMDKAFEVAVGFTAIDMMTAPMEKMAGKMGMLGQRAEETQKKLNGFKNMAFVGGAITMAGSMMVSAIEKGVKEAGEFLTKMTIIKDTTGATADQMERIQKIIRSSSGQTIFGVQETAGFGKLLATSGMSADQIGALLPVFTQYAEVQKLGKESSPEEAITQAIGAAHMTGNYDPEALQAFLDKYNKATFMQPGSSSEFADTFKYLSSRTQGIGMTTDDQLTMAALSNRVGLAGSIGGTEGADMILRSIPGLMGGRGKKESKQTAALEALGLSNTIFDSDGQFKGVSNFIQQLQKASVGKNPEELTKLYHDAFGQQGMGLANILSSPRGQEQLKALSEQMGGMKSIGQMQEDTNKTPQGQMLQLGTNIENLKLGVFLKLAEALNPTWVLLNNIVSKISEFVDAHPMINNLVADFEMLFGAVALTVGPILLFAGAIGYLATAKTIAVGLRMLGGAFSFLFGLIRGIGAFMMANPMLLGIMLIIGALYLLYKAWQNNWGGIREKFAAVSDWISEHWRGIITAMLVMMGPFGWAIIVLVHVIRENWGSISSFMSKLWDTISKDATEAWTWITSSLSKIWKDFSDGIENNIKYLGDKFEELKKSWAGEQLGGVGKWFKGQVGEIGDMGNSLANYTFGDADVGHNASGTNFWEGGPTWVNERGAELINLPRGSQVIPHDKSTESSNPIVINVYASAGQDERTIAQMVMDELGRLMRDQSLSRGSNVTPAW